MDKVYVVKIGECSYDDHVEIVAICDGPQQALRVARSEEVEDQTFTCMAIEIFAYPLNQIFLNEIQEFPGRYVNTFDNNQQALFRRTPFSNDKDTTVIFEEEWLDEEFRKQVEFELSPPPVVGQREYDEAIRFFAQKNGLTEEEMRRMVHECDQEAMKQLEAEDAVEKDSGSH